MSLSELTSDKADIIRLFITGILFGLYIASFVHCLRWLVCQDVGGWRVRKKVKRVMLGITIYISLFSTVNFLNVILSTFPLGSSQRGSAREVRLFQWFATVIMYRSAILTIDSVLIYRCWMVFAKSWRVIYFPLVALTLSMIGAIVQSCCDVSTWASHPGIGETAFCRSNGWLETFYLCNVITTIYTTSATVFRIWRVGRVGIGNSTSHLYRLCRILTESGILYTSSSVFYSISFFVPVNAVTAIIVSGTAGPLMLFMPGIAFNLLLIRVGEQRARVAAADSRNAKKTLPSPLRFNLRFETREDFSDLDSIDGGSSY